MAATGQVLSVAIHQLTISQYSFLAIFSTVPFEHFLKYFLGVFWDFSTSKPYSGGRRSRSYSSPSINWQFHTTCTASENQRKSIICCRRFGEMFCNILRKEKYPTHSILLTVLLDETQQGKRVNPMKIVKISKQVNHEASKMYRDYWIIKWLNVIFDSITL